MSSWKQFWKEVWQGFGGPSAIAEGYKPTPPIGERRPDPPPMPPKMKDGYTNMARNYGDGYSGLTGVYRKMEEDEIIAKALSVPLEKVERAFFEGCRTLASVKGFIARSK